MDYEQKYKDALERAKIFKGHLLEIDEKDYADEMEYIFPELRESEDDGIRKAILSGMNFLKFQGRETFGGIAIDDCIAWLKKQFIKEDSPETKAIKEQIENLKKRIEDNQLGCIVQRLDKIIELLQSAILVLPKEPYVPPIIYKRPLDPDPNVLEGLTTTASTFGADYDIDTDKIKQDETNKPKS